MTKPVATVTQIDNGFLVTTMSSQSQVVRGRSNQPESQPEQIVKFCEGYEEVCEALKAEFPPSMLS